jgi:hypothetical protein
MADITNAEAVAFCNDKIRPVADKLAQAYYDAKIVVDDWTANSMGTLIPNSASDIVVDGSATDGRHVISGADATTIVTRCMEFVADMEANNNAKLNTILSVAVNVGD